MLSATAQNFRATVTTKQNCDWITGPGVIRMSELNYHRLLISSHMFLRECSIYLRLQRTSIVQIVGQLAVLKTPLNITDGVENFISTSRSAILLFGLNLPPVTNWTPL
jgi:hypothetical protein